MGEGVNSRGVMGSRSVGDGHVLGGVVGLASDGAEESGDSLRENLFVDNDSRWPSCLLYYWLNI